MILAASAPPAIIPYFDSDNVRISEGVRLVWFDNRTRLEMTGFVLPISTPFKQQGIFCRSGLFVKYGELVFEPLQDVLINSLWVMVVPLFPKSYSTFHQGLSNGQN